MSSPKERLQRGAVLFRRCPPECVRGLGSSKQGRGPAGRRRRRARGPRDGAPQRPLRSAPGSRSTGEPGKAPRHPAEQGCQHGLVQGFVIIPLVNPVKGPFCRGFLGIHCPCRMPSASWRSYACLATRMWRKRLRMLWRTWRVMTPTRPPSTRPGLKRGGKWWKRFAQHSGLSISNIFRNLTKSTVFTIQRASPLSPRLAKEVETSGPKGKGDLE